MPADLETPDEISTVPVEGQPSASPLSETETLEELGSWPTEWVERACQGHWELDLGSARGHFLTAAASAWPDRCFLGLEWQAHRVRFTRRKLRHLGLDNARAVRGEILTLLQEKIPPASVARVHVLFPDPWPKRRHARRRLLQPATLAALARVVRTGGEFRFLTDAAPYHEQAVSLLQTSPHWEITNRDPIAGWPASEFQTRFTKMGLPVFGFLALRNETPAAPLLAISSPLSAAQADTVNGR
jgi:tRNA (guanine-N7-)-methyltransferase